MIGQTAIKVVTRAVVVVSHVADRAVVVGEPAKVIKYRKPQLSAVVMKAEEFSQNHG